MGCEFSLKVLAVAVQRAFRDGLDQGVNYVTRLGPRDLGVRAEEILRPEAAYFLTPIETRINPLTGKEDLYWQGYRRSIDESMRRNIALLKVQGASTEKIEQAITERKTWQMIKDKGLNLNEGQGILFMALKTTNPTEGVAVQQLSRKDGQLVLESRLLPFDQINQIENFREFLGEKRDDISFVPEEQGVDSIVSWAVEGEALDFQQELPELIDQAQKLPQSDFLLEEYEQRQQFSEMFPATMPTRLDLVGKLPELEIPVQVSSEVGFWFKVMAVAMEPIIQNKQNVAKKSSVEVPTRSDLVGRKEVVKVEKKQEKIVKQTPSGIILEGVIARREEAVKPEKKQNKVKVPASLPAGEAGIILAGTVDQWKEGKEIDKKIEKSEVVVFKPVTVKAEKKKEQKIEKVEQAIENKSMSLPSCEAKTISLGTIIIEPEKIKEAAIKAEDKKKVVWRRQEQQPEKTRMEVKPMRQKERKKKSKSVIPIWAAELNPVEAKDIPWWQPNLSADTELIEAERIVVLTIFFLIVNKKRLQKIKISNF